MADAKLDFSKNHLLYGDCLDMLPLLDDEVVDLIYLDPPFNSNQNFNMLFVDETSQDSFTGQTFPKIQIFTIDQLFQGHRPAMPAPLNPYTKATYAHADTRQQSLI